MPRHIDWEKARRRDLARKWQSVPLEAPVVREPEGSPELRGERAIEVWISDSRPEDCRPQETCSLKLQYKHEKRHTIVYHFIGIAYSEAAATFPLRHWTPSEVDDVLTRSGYVQQRYQKEHVLEVRVDINVFSQENIG